MSVLPFPLHPSMEVEQGVTLRVYVCVYVCIRPLQADAYIFLIQAVNN